MEYHLSYSPFIMKVFQYTNIVLLESPENLHLTTRWISLSYSKLRCLLGRDDEDASRCVMSEEVQFTYRISRYIKRLCHSIFSLEHSEDRFSEARTLI